MANENAGVMKVLIHHERKLRAACGTPLNEMQEVVVAVRELIAADKEFDEARAEGDKMRCIRADHRRKLALAAAAGEA